MIIKGDSLYELKHLESDSIDLVCTDPPYGYSFMGKDWDKAVPSVEIWQECLRVLKPGAFCFVMSAPRSDVQMHMITNLTAAGFRLDFTPIYWTYASGFPKAQNIAKFVDKRQRGSGVIDRINALLTKGLTLVEIGQKCGIPSLESSYRDWTTGGHMPEQRSWERIQEGLQLTDADIAELDLIITHTRTDYIGGGNSLTFREGEKRPYEVKYTQAKSDQAKALDGSYAGFQPKPAVEVIIVAMKPLSEKTYVDQALKNGKGITWLDDVRIPAETGADLNGGAYRGKRDEFNGATFNIGSTGKEYQQPQGRFPANLLVSDDVLNDGKERHARGNKAPEIRTDAWFKGGYHKHQTGSMDSGSYSRYFDLDKWANTLPFLIVPKASKREKNEGLKDFKQPKQNNRIDQKLMRCATCNKYKVSSDYCKCKNPDWQMKTVANHHPTVKPLKLMSYLITLASREGDAVLDPFCGSGTTVLAAKKLGRKGIGIEREAEYVEIAEARLDADKQESLL